KKTYCAGQWPTCHTVSRRPLSRRTRTRRHRPGPVVRPHAGAPCGFLERMRDEVARGTTRRWTAPVKGVALPAVVLLLLLSVMVSALLTGPQIVRLPAAERTVIPPVPESREIPTLQPPTATPSASGRFAESPWLATTMTVIAALILGAGAVAVVWLLVRHRRRLRLRFAFSGPVHQAATEQDEGADDEAVTAAVRAGLEALDDEDGDPRRAVIACWPSLEAAAMNAGVERRPDDAPADLVARLLRTYDVDPEVLHDLAALYRRARYAPADVDVAMRTQARAPLEER